MVNFTVLLYFLVFFQYKFIAGEPLTDSSDIGLDPTQLIENHGYSCETHYITTDDGYILSYHRIPHGVKDSDPKPRPAVLLMHEYAGSSADYVTLGPENSLGFILADSGYDVWLANARGNAFSRNHTNLDPIANEDQFYNFTWNEIGYFDIAKAIDYILEVTGDENLYYIAHSQGTTAFFVLASTRPEYNAKIRLASLMAPAAIVQHFPSILVQELCKYIDQVELILNKWKLYQIPFTNEIRERFSTKCKDPNTDSVCQAVFNLISLVDIEIEKEMMPVIFTNLPSNSGLKQLIHFGQLVRDGGFSQFDYGVEKNIEVYGSEKPPAYNLSQISAPIAFYYSKDDGLITVEDEKTLINMIPNVANDYLITEDLFRHIDFVYAKDVVKLVYTELIRVMNYH